MTPGYKGLMPLRKKMTKKRAQRILALAKAATPAAPKAMKAMKKWSVGARTNQSRTRRKTKTCAVLCARRLWITFYVWCLRFEHVFKYGRFLFVHRWCFRIARVASFVGVDFPMRARVVKHSVKCQWSGSIWFCRCLFQGRSSHRDDCQKSVFRYMISAL